MHAADTSIGSSYVDVVRMTVKHTHDVSAHTSQGLSHEPRSRTGDQHDSRSLGTRWELGHATC